MSFVDSVLLSFLCVKDKQLQISQKLLNVILFTILICCTRKKGFQAFIYIYYKSFDIHICSTRTGSFYAFCINRLK